MYNSPPIRKISYFYLLLVPAVVTALAFSIGHTGPQFYVPAWLLNAFMMFLAGRQLAISAPPGLNRSLWLLVFPWMLIAIFGGMGPPPNTPAGWAALPGEQVTRFTILIFCGLSVTSGFDRLNKFLAGTPDSRFSRLGTWMVRFALPLFILNAAYWGYLMTYVFVTYTAPGAPAQPGWVKTVSDAATIIRVTEIDLFYLATAAFAVALMAAGMLSKVAGRIYVICAISGAILNLLPDSIPPPLAIPIYIAGIPAYTLLMPYLIAVNIWRKQTK
jgi:hypothetical protein